MKNINKKGMGLIGAIMIITLLLIMSLGFFQLTDYSTSSTKRDIDRLKLQWAAESAANYNVNWWTNQLDSIRKDWPVTYIPPGETTIYLDNAGTALEESIFQGAVGITSDKKLYLHSSWQYEGKPGENADLQAMDGYRIYLTRYKGERIDRPGEAVWVLESTAYDPVTDNAIKITMANIYNIEIEVELFWLQQAEAISKTMLGAGDGGNRGFFGDNDYRFGNCYFSDPIQMTFGGMGQSDGPKFFGTVKSSSTTISDWGSSTNSLSAITDTNSGSDIYHGLTGITSDFASVTDEQVALDLMAQPFKGTYLQDQTVIDSDNFVWTWEDIEDYSGQSHGFGIYNVADELPGLLNDDVNIVLRTEDLTNTGLYTTYADISQNGTIVQTLQIGESTGSWQMIAVPDGYGNVSIEGVSNDDFALATESSTVEIAGSLYLQGMESAYNDLLALENDLDDYSVEEMRILMKDLYNQMENAHPDGHLGLLSCLGNKDGTNVNEESFLIVPEELIFMNVAMLSWNGSLEALKATSTGTDLRLFNIGSSITLGNQSAIASAGSDKWDNLLIQDERYNHDDEDVFPGIGSSPSEIEHERLQGLNPRYKWSKKQYGAIGGEDGIYSILPGTE